MQTDILLGRTPEGETVTVSIALRPAHAIGRGDTVAHATIPEGSLNLSIQGNMYEAGRLGAGGQVIEEARRVLPSKWWTEADLTRLTDIWERWHLNEMRAGCTDQTPVYELDRYGRSVPSLDLTPPCSITGYRYGSAWLFEALPADVIEDVHRFQRRAGYPGYVR